MTTAPSHCLLLFYFLNSLDLLTVLILKKTLRYIQYGVMLIEYNPRVAEEMNINKLFYIQTVKLRIQMEFIIPSQ